MPSTFDALASGDGPACVQALRELDIRISQRLGARLVALARRRVRFSLALLEGAAPGSALETLLLDESLKTASADALKSLGLHVIEDGDALSVVAADEIDDEPSPNGATSGQNAASVGPASTSATSQATKAARSGSAPPVPTPLARPASHLPAVVQPFGWNAAGAGMGSDQVEQAAIAFLDSENLSEVIEKLRFLFRTALGASQDPTPLLCLALRRGKPQLSQEVASLVRDHLDRDMGRALEDLLGADEARIRDGVHFLLEAAAAPGSLGSLRLLIMPALQPLLSQPLALRHVLARLETLTPLAALGPDTLEDFLVALLRNIDELEAPERFAIARFLLAIAPSYAELVEFIFRRMRGTADPHLMAFYGNVLSRLDIGVSERRQCAEMLVKTLIAHSQDVGLLERLKATFLNLGADPLDLLTDEATAEKGKMPGALRGYVTDLWAAYLAARAPHPPLERMAAFVASEIGARNRSAIINVLRNGLIHQAALFEALEQNEFVRQTVMGVMLEEAPLLEEPDDAEAIAFLARFGWPAVELSFERTREEAALESRAAPHRLRVFAHLAAQATLRDDELRSAAGLVEQVLGFPFVTRADLPVIFESLGTVGRVPDLPDEVLGELLDRILPPALAKGAAAFPAPDTTDETLRLLHGARAYPADRVQAALSMYGGRACPPEVRRRIEERIEGVVATEKPARAWLLAALAGLESLMRATTVPLRLESITVMLARTVLKKSREATLDSVLAGMLSEEAEGLGVMVPEPWSKADRDHALRILGEAAARTDTSDDLHRMMVARLSGFLDDWLDAQERGRNLYLYRDTPLWSEMVKVVRARPSEWAVEAVVRLGLRVMEVHRKVPHHLSLERREDTQRLLAELLWLAPQEPVEVRGSMRLDIPKAALGTLMGLASRDNPAAIRLLRECHREPRLPARLREQLEGWLRFHPTAEEKPS
jgi:hypothetical protein